MPQNEFQSLIADSDLVITHDGSGTVASALEARKPVIVVPRKLDELSYEGNAELAGELARLNWVLVARDARGLSDALARLPSLKPERAFQGPTIASCITQELEKTKAPSR